MLLLEKLRTKASSQENNVCIQNGQFNGSQMINVNSMKNHYPTLEQQRRRPSSIAEQAMRKLGISNSCYNRNEQSLRQPHTSIISNADKTMESIPSVITLRDTSIREQCPSPTINASSNLHLFRDNSSIGYCRGSSYLGLARDRIDRECHSSINGQYSLNTSGRESSCLLSRDNCMSSCFQHRSPSNRLLASGIDQRIIKQSTEDCRRLLQQVRSINIIFVNISLS